MWLLIIIGDKIVIKKSFSINQLGNNQHLELKQLDEVVQNVLPFTARFISVFQIHSIYSFGLTTKEHVLLQEITYKHSSMLHAT